MCTLRSPMPALGRFQASAPHHSERGAAVIVLLYALAVFSVLGLSVLRRPPLEMHLRTSDDPDLHVVLYAGGAGTQKVVGRLNLPNSSRPDGEIVDDSVVVEAPGPVDSDVSAELEAGWAYAVQLSSELRVCCDGGDDACSNVPWEQQVPSGSVTPAGRRLTSGEADQQLQFNLSSYDVPPNADFDRRGTPASAFMLKAMRVPAGENVTIADGASTVACRLVTTGRPGRKRQVAASAWYGRQRTTQSRDLGSSGHPLSATSEITPPSDPSLAECKLHSARQYGCLRELAKVREKRDPRQYAVQLAPQLRVCCDGGTDACGDLPWEQQVPEG